MSLSFLHNRRSLPIDYDPHLLEVIEQNRQINDDVCNKESLQTQQFDWKQFESNQIDDGIEIILAADGRSFIRENIALIELVLVIYDDDLTDALFDVLTKFFQSKAKLVSIYITIEKRINFYLQTMSVQCPAYEYFLEKMSELKTNTPQLIMEEIPTDSQSIKQCTPMYQRTEELVNMLAKKCFFYYICFLGILAYLSFRKIFTINCMYLIENTCISKVLCCVSIIEHLS